jgi:hypothetical protein
MVDLALWDKGEYKKFGQQLRQERKKIPPRGWSQNELAKRVVAGLGRGLKVVQRHPELLRMTRVETPAALDFEAYDYSSKEEVWAEIQPFVDEARAEDAAIDQLLMDAHDMLSGLVLLRMNPEPGEPMDAFGRLVLRWRNRVASIEAGRRTDRRTVQMVANEVNLGLKRIDTLASYFGEVDREDNDRVTPGLKLPYLGGIPRQASLADFEDIASERQISVHPDWATAEPTFAVRAESNEYFPIFTMSELIAIQRAPIFSPRIVALVVTPGSQAIFCFLESLGSGEYQVLDLKGAPIGHWGDGWHLVGYPVARESRFPFGLRLKPPPPPV